MDTKNVNSNAIFTLIIICFPDCFYINFLYIKKKTLLHDLTFKCVIIG